MVRLRFIDAYVCYLESHMTIADRRLQSHRMGVEPIHVQHHTQKCITVAHHLSSIIDIHTKHCMR